MTFTICFLQSCPNARGNPVCQPPAQPVLIGLRGRIPGTAAGAPVVGQVDGLVVDHLYAPLFKGLSKRLRTGCRFPRKATGR